MRTKHEIEQTRNKRILEINRERIFKDFAVKAKRFQDFKDTYKEFSDKQPWNSLLKLGDMNKFLNMSHQDREGLIKTIKDQAQSILTEGFTIDDDDVPALQNMMRLTNSNTLSDQQQQRYDQTLTEEFSSKTADEKQEIIKNLKMILKESLTESLKQLKEFNDAMELIKDDINSLDRARTMKDFGNAAFWVLGTAAGVCMLGHGALVIEGVKITMEKFAIGAKVGLAAGHLGAHSEAELSRHIQTQFKKIIEPLLPKTTKLLETTTYKNNAQGIGDRLKEKVSKITNWAKSKVSEETRNNIDNNLKNIKSSITKTVNSIKNSSANETLNQGFDAISHKLSTGLKATKEAISNTHQKITKSDAYQKISKKFDQARDAIRSKLKNQTPQDVEENRKKYEEFNPALGYIPQN